VVAIQSMFHIAFLIDLVDNLVSILLRPCCEYGHFIVLLHFFNELFCVRSDVVFFLVNIEVNKSFI
jgi:hypothetical protein